VEQAAIEKQTGDARLEVKGGPSGSAAAGPSGDTGIHRCVTRKKKNRI